MSRKRVNFEDSFVCPDDFGCDAKIVVSWFAWDFRYQVLMPGEEHAPLIYNVERATQERVIPIDLELGKSYAIEIVPRDGIQIISLAIEYEAA